MNEINNPVHSNFFLERGREEYSSQKPREVNEAIFLTVSLRKKFLEFDKLFYVSSTELRTLAVENEYIQSYMAESRGGPSKLPPLPDSRSSRPTWSVTRREQTELSPSRSTSPFQSRTVTTTERVQIIQMPITLTDEQVAPARLLTLTPHGNTTQSVSSTTTTIPGECVPLIGCVTATGTPVLQGTLSCCEARHTTTIITTTTTTYRMVEISDSDSLSEDFEVLDENTLTVDVSLLTPGTSSPQSPEYMIVGKKESEAQLSPIEYKRMNVDLHLPYEGIERLPELEEKPINEMVTMYHSGYSDQSNADKDDGQFPSTFEKVSDLNKTYYKTKDGEYISSESRRDIKEESTSSEEEDIILIETGMSPMDISAIVSEEENTEEKTIISSSTKSQSYSTPEENRWVYQELNEDSEDMYTERLINIDYPSQEIYQGPLDYTEKINDIQGEPLTHHVTVYHSGRSDEPTVKPDEAHIDLADAAKTFGDKITGIFKRRPTIPDYPSSEPYDGPLADTRRREDIDSQPISNIVSVYHSGRSDIPHDKAPVIKDEVIVAKDIVYDYPRTAPYEGPLDYTERINDIEGEPLTHHVTVYHSGRSDEPTVKPDEAHIDLADAAKTFGVKITGLFKKGAAHLDYPVSEAYEGPLDYTQRISDIDGEPLTHHVTVYHSGRSDEPTVKPDEAHIDLADAAKTFGDKITGLFKRRPTIPDYPSSEPYDGPLADTRRREDIDSQPISNIVSVYHSGRSDIPHDKAPVIKDEVIVAKDIVYDYPRTAPYEGPLDYTERINDIEGEPLTHHVTVYHSGRSDEPTVKPDEAHIDLADAAKTFGVKITGLFKKGAAHLDYPVSEAYEGPLDYTQRISDIDGEPLTHHVTVYHSGRSDEPTVKPDEAHIDLADAAKTFGVKITGLFKKGAAHLDYPVSEAYEGPLDYTQRISDIDGEPLTHHVTVYHSGRSDEPTVKPDEAHIDLADAAKTFGVKITGLFKKGAAHLDYPVSEAYEGPLDYTQRISDIDGEPLTHHVTVYHSGRSDEPTVKPDEAHIDLADAAKTFGVKITGLFKKGAAHLDYPVSEAYEGPLDYTQRISDIDGEPLTHHVTVYHSGRSDEPTKGAAHLDYPVSEAYEGPLDYTERINDIEGEPLTHHVTVYHSGRSDEPTVKPDEAHIDLADAAKTFGVKITGLFKKGAAHLDYPVSEAYEGPLDYTQRISDIDGEPLTHHVTVYHSGRSDEPTVKPDEAHIDLADAAKTFGVKITGLFKKGAAHLDYPVSEAYEGPLDYTQRISDIDGEPLTHHVTVGRSDEPTVKPDEAHIDLADAAKTFGVKITGLFKKGAAHLDYPVSEAYEGPLDYTQRISDIDGEPLTHHVTVYHSGRSDVVEEKLRPSILDEFQPEHFTHTVKKQSHISDLRMGENVSQHYDEVSALKNGNMIDLDVHLSVRSPDTTKGRDFSNVIEEDLHDESPVFLCANNLERDQTPVGFSVSISARQPDNRKSSEVFSSSIRELSSDKRYHEDHSFKNERDQRRQVSPHTWTTIRERTNVTYVRKVFVERSLRSRTPLRSNFIRRVPYKSSAGFTDNASSCRSKSFDEHVMVHHPIYPPNESLYRTSTQNGGSHSSYNRMYSPVREVAAFDRTEWVNRHSSYIPPNRRSEDIFTVGTPFIMGQVERDSNGCAYLRYQNSGLQEQPPLMERLDDLPMIEEGAIECRRATVRAGLREMDAVNLVEDEEELERRHRPIRRARQRMRNYCTML
ncbi:hypothetical protein DICVIV_01400 [Dictyocaulus viviparus]|uniref:Uncharacterized protein n=1 Tax=Dictyocaulus viviparus TaxID=29172 RepID=A0A0D8Y6E2_DICVI|nr:hypothetical protein DICVIV_01400 [Dictyocaulus viviparus]